MLVSKDIGIPQGIGTGINDIVSKIFGEIVCIFIVFRVLIGSINKVIVIIVINGNPDLGSYG